jgi:hypothetical protein
MLRIPHCLDNRHTNGGKVVSLTHRPLSDPQKHYLYASDTHFCKGLSEPQGLVRLERSRKLKTSLTSSDLEPATSTWTCILKWTRLFAPFAHKSRDIYHYANAGYHSNAFFKSNSCITVICACYVRGSSLLFQFIASTLRDDFLMWITDGIRLTICACYS